eukprot:4094192-Prymnesium_polylepis.1
MPHAPRSDGRRGQARTGARARQDGRELSRSATARSAQRALLHVELREQTCTTTCGCLQGGAGRARDSLATARGGAARTELKARERVQRQRRWFARERTICGAESPHKADGTALRGRGRSAGSTPAAIERAVAPLKSAKSGCRFAREAETPTATAHTTATRRPHDVSPHGSRRSRSLDGACQRWF